MDLCPAGPFYISRYASWNIFVITQQTVDSRREIVFSIEVNYGASYSEIIPNVDDTVKEDHCWRFCVRSKCVFKVSVLLFCSYKLINYWEFRFE